MPVEKPEPPIFNPCLRERVNVVAERPSVEAHVDAIARELRGQESRRYEQAVTRLRAAGCRCMLRSDGDRAIPLTTAERDACGRHEE